MQKTTQGARERETGLELLRILMMICIVFNHYAGYGGFSFGRNLSVNSAFILVAHMGGKMAVNVFILISGYFLCTAQTDPQKQMRKISKLFLQVLFYSIIILFMGRTFGFLSSKDIIPYLFAPFYSKWGFVTYYLLMYLLSPWVNAALKESNTISLLTLWTILTVIWCLIPSVSAAKSGIEYGLVWFLYMYMTATLLKRTRKAWEPKWKLLLLAAFCNIFLIAALEILFLKLGESLEVFYKSREIFRAYNNALTVSCSVLLFAGFKGLRMKSNTIINRVASASFGVFLLHDGAAVGSFIWQRLFRSAEIQYSNWLIPNAFIACGTVYIIGVAIDLFRQDFIEKPLMPILYRCTDSAREIALRQIERLNKRLE